MASTLVDREAKRHSLEYGVMPFNDNVGLSQLLDFYRTEEGRVRCTYKGFADFMAMPPVEETWEGTEEVDSEPQVKNPAYETKAAVVLQNKTTGKRTIAAEDALLALAYLDETRKKFDEDEAPYRPYSPSDESPGNRFVGELIKSLGFEKRIEVSSLKDFGLDVTLVTYLNQLQGQKLVSSGSRYLTLSEAHTAESDKTEIDEYSVVGVIPAPMHSDKFDDLALNLHHHCRDVINLSLTSLFYKKGHEVLWKNFAKADITKLTHKYMPFLRRDRLFDTLDL